MYRFILGYGIDSPSPSPPQTLDLTLFNLAKILYVGSSEERD